MTVKSKKRRLKRAHTHQALAKGKDQFFNAFEKAGLPEKEATVLASEPNILERMVIEGEVVQEIPSRAKCPSCGFSHKVRKNGTMSRHDVFAGSDPTQCEGSGKLWQ